MLGADQTQTGLLVTGVGSQWRVRAAEEMSMLAWLGDWLQVASRDPALYELSIVVRCPHPPPAILVDAHHLHLLALHQANVILS